MLYGIAKSTNRSNSSSNCHLMQILSSDMNMHSRLAALNRGYQSPAYNQVVAWLRLVWDGPGPAVKGYAYQVSQRRIVRNFKPGRFNWRGKVLEAWFTNDDTSKEIAVEIRKRIANTGSKGKIFHRRYIDLEAFDSLAPHLDWRNLLGLREG